MPNALQATGAPSQNSTIPYHTIPPDVTGRFTYFLPAERGVHECVRLSEVKYAAAPQGAAGVVGVEAASYPNHFCLVFVFFVWGVILPRSESAMEDIIHAR